MHTTWEVVGTELALAGAGVQKVRVFTGETNRRGVANLTAWNGGDAFLAVGSGRGVEEVLVETASAGGGVVASVTAFDRLVANVTFLVGG